MGCMSAACMGACMGCMAGELPTDGLPSSGNTRSDVLLLGCPLPLSPRKRLLLPELWSGLGAGLLEGNLPQCSARNCSSLETRQQTGSLEEWQWKQSMKSPPSSWWFCLLAVIQALPAFKSSGGPHPGGGCRISPLMAQCIAFSIWAKPSSDLGCTWRVSCMPGLLGLSYPVP